MPIAINVEASHAKATLFKNATIISYDKSSQSLKILRDASMLIKDNIIAALSEDGEKIEDVPLDAEIIDATNKIVSPGFVDTHHHIYQTPFRTMGADVTLLEYFSRYAPMGPSQQHFTVDDMYLGQLAGLLELIDCGTTTVLDHALGTFSEGHVDAAFNATFESGLRVFFAHAIEAVGETGLTFEQSVTKFKIMQKDKRIRDKSNPVELGISYDKWFIQDETQSKKTQQIADLLVEATKSDNQVAVLTTHMVGGPYGALNTPTLLSNALRPLQSSLSTTTKAEPLPVVISHASFLSSIDAMILRDPHGQNPHLKMTISTTPESEMHYGHTSTGAEDVQTHSSLGVDTHFTFSSYIPFQARIWLQSQRLRRYTQTTATNLEMPINNPMSVNDAFLLATQKGGEALGRQDLGVICEGAAADIVMYSTESTGLWGWHDPVAAIILHSGPADIDGVMVSGKWVKRQNRIVSPLIGQQAEGYKPVEVQDVKKRFEESARKIQKIWSDELEPFVAPPEGADWAGGIAKFGCCRKVNVRRDANADVSNGKGTNTNA